MHTLVLLTLSNVFMTFAWYYHLKHPQLKQAPLLIAILVSWGIAFFEYCLQVPGNRLGARAGFSIGQLKIAQEAITLAVFCLFVWLVMGEKLTWNYYAGFALVLAGVFVVFHFKPEAPSILHGAPRAQIHEASTGGPGSTHPRSTAQRAERIE